MKKHIGIVGTLILFKSTAETEEPPEFAAIEKTLLDFVLVKFKKNPRRAP